MALKDGKDGGDHPAERPGRTDWIELQDLGAAAAGYAAPEILFPGNLGGTRREPSYMAENWLRYKLWFPMVTRAGLRRLDMHSIRHTYASRLIGNGENLTYVQEQLAMRRLPSPVTSMGI
ncbi:MAG: hypothetical protein H8K05_02535 [Nitrospira sp.]|nr:hypothetical protein [Nitrospira sp.]